MVTGPFCTRHRILRLWFWTSNSWKVPSGTQAKIWGPILEGPPHDTVYRTQRPECEPIGPEFLVVHLEIP